MSEAAGIVVMVGPSPDSMGGVSSVLAVYRDFGLFDSSRVVFVATYVDGGKLKKAWVGSKALWRVVCQLLKANVVCVHAHVAIDASFWRKGLFMGLAALAGRPFVFHLHAGGFAHYFDATLGRFGKAVARWLFRHAARVVVLSPEWSSWVHSVEPSARTVVIPNPVLLGDLEKRDPDPETVLFLGRLGAKKGTVDLIQALATVVRSFPNVVLYLAGDGDAAGTLAQAKALGVERNVEISGWIRGDRKSALMARTSVFVLPSYYEGLPMSVLEAMAWGIPVVTTDVGGIPSAVTDGVEGMLIRPGDVDGLANAILRLLGNPDLRREMGAAGRRRVLAQFSANAVVPRVSQLHREIAQPIQRVVSKCS